MALQSVNPSPLLADYLVRTGAFADCPVQVVDVGARSGFEPHWEAVFKNQVRLLGFEPDAEECERLNQPSNAGIKTFLPYALHADEGSRDFFITAFPASCGFYQPDQTFWKRFPDQINLEVVRTKRIGTRSLTSVLEEHGLRTVDFIKLDTEGCELDVLRGATDILDRSVLGLSVEAEFSEVHHHQPLFSDVDQFLRGRRFELMDLSTYNHSRLALPRTLEAHYSGQGQLLWGQALYLRDAVRELRDPDTRGEWDLVRVLKMASIMDLFSLQDSAAELILEAAAQGLCPRQAAVEYLDCAASSMSGHRVTYDQYFALLVVRGLPRFLQSAATAAPGTAAALTEVAEHLRARHVAVAIRSLIDLFTNRLDDRATDAEGLWLRLYFTHLVRYEEPIRDLYDRLESYAGSREVLDALRTVDGVLQAALPLEIVATTPSAEDEDGFALLRANIVAHLAERPPRRLVCYGAGTDFVELVRSGVFDAHAVVAVVDNVRARGTLVAGVPVVRHDDLSAIEHDMVVVTASRWAGELRTAAVRWTAEHAPSIPVI